MDAGIKELLERRKNRSIAIILAHKEEEADEYLPSEVSASLRKTLLDQVNDFYNLVLDVINSMDTESITLNKYYLELLEDIHNMIAQEE